MNVIAPVLAPARLLFLWVAWHPAQVMFAAVCAAAGTALAFFVWGWLAHRLPYVPDGGPNTDDDPAVQREVLS